MPDRFPIPDAIHKRRERAPFFAEALPCECCGAPCDELVFNVKCGCLTGTKCECSIPDEPNICAALWAIYENPPCETLGELNKLTRAHKAHCPVCTPALRKEVASETRDAADERRRA